MSFKAVDAVSKLALGQYKNKMVGLISKLRNLFSIFQNRGVRSHPVSNKTAQVLGAVAPPETIKGYIFFCWCIYSLLWEVVKKTQ